MPNETSLRVGKADSGTGVRRSSVYFKDPSGQQKQAIFANKQARNRALLAYQKKRYPDAYAQSMKAIESSGRSEEIFGKADEVKELPIPEWARASFASTRPLVANPLDMYAGSRMMAFGGNNMKGKINWPWRRDRMARGGYEYVQGRAMVYAPLGTGRSYG